MKTAVLLTLLLFALSCGGNGTHAPRASDATPPKASPEPVTPGEGTASLSRDKPIDFARARELMIQKQIAARGVRDPGVLAAMREVPRHLFVEPAFKNEAYEDHPVPIGEGQTISQPYIVALMTELLHLKPSDRVLEIGTGSGYQSAVLSRIAHEVYTIEIRPTLSQKAAERLKALGYDNVHPRVGDGYRGWPEEAPFNGIVVTAAPERIPTPLLDQLAPGGRMVIPVGGFFQELKVFTKHADGTVTEKDVIPVRFVPMTGEAEGHGAGSP
jgi:protein-L-isoaspartate(D-aspartate) O-methyltransferase